MNPLHYLQNHLFFIQLTHEDDAQPYQETIGPPTAPLTPFILSQGPLAGHQTVGMSQRLPNATQVVAKGEGGVKSL